MALALIVSGALVAVVRPEQTATAVTTGTATTAPLLVATEEVLGGHPGPVLVEVTGQGPVLVAVGRADDVAAWAEGAALTTASALTGDHGVVMTSTAGQEQVPDPAGSDLWTAHTTGVGSAQLTVDPAAGDAVLIASDGSRPAPAGIELRWTDPPVPTAAWVLLGAGALVGAVLGGAAARSARAARKTVSAAQAVQPPTTVRAEDVPRRRRAGRWYLRRRDRAAAEAIIDLRDGAAPSAAAGRRQAGEDQDHQERQGRLRRRSRR